MKLDDLEAIDPDWSTVLVYSDYLEEVEDNLPHAEALRWLYKYNHWPQKHSEYSASWGWYCVTSYTSPTLITSRYSSGHAGHAREEDLLYEIWRRATLPPEFEMNSSRSKVTFTSIMTLYLHRFASHIKTSSFAPKLLPHFQSTLPRSLKDIHHQCNSQPQPLATPASATRPSP